MKKSRPTGKRVKKKASENLEKQKKERKTKLVDTGNTTEGDSTTGNYGNYYTFLYLKNIFSKSWCEQSL